jgi:hypothetical protein
MFFSFFYSQFFLAQNNRVTYDFHIVSDETVLKTNILGVNLKDVKGQNILVLSFAIMTVLPCLRTRDVMDTENNEISSAVSYSGISRKYLYL